VIDGSLDVGVIGVVVLALDREDRDLEFLDERCVDSGFDAQSTTSAPPAFSVRIRLAVSVVTCRQAETR
jgi:hypothetical protein